MVEVYNDSGTSFQANVGLRNQREIPNLRSGSKYSFFVTTRVKYNDGTNEDIASDVKDFFTSEFNFAILSLVAYLKAKGEAIGPCFLLR